MPWKGVLFATKVSTSYVEVIFGLTQGVLDKMSIFLAVGLHMTTYIALFLFFGLFKGQKS